MNMSTTTVRMLGHAPAALARVDLTARQAITLACTAMAGVAALDIAGDGKIGLLFSVGFVLIAITTPLSVNRCSLFGPGILPPLLMLTSVVVFAAALPSALPSDGIPASAGVLQRTLAGIVDQATALIVGHLLALGAIGLRILSCPDEIDRA